MTTGDWAAIVSAVAALFAFGFSIFVYFRTQRLILPTERPVIELSENKCSGTLSDDKSILQINMLFIFENVGKHPASDRRVQIGTCPISAAHQFRNYVDGTAANAIRPGTKFNWDQRMEFPVKVEDQVIELPNLELIVYVRITYNDAWQPKRKRYVDDFYLTYTVGKAAAAHATSDQRRMIEEQVKRIYTANG
jgi:hypothetical protein